MVGAVSIATLLIGYYHGLLLRDIDSDLLTDKMCSSGLLTADEQSLISSGHTVHHSNWLLLEHVRHMELPLLLEFCKLIEKEWVDIGSQLTTGLYVTLHQNIIHKYMILILVSNPNRMCLPARVT